MLSIIKHSTYIIFGEKLKFMSIKNNILFIRKTIAQTALRYGRKLNSIHLMAVSKGQTSEAIREAYATGIRDFGENYWQEAKTKILQLQDLADIRWHFIGAIQSNKVKQLANQVDWVHSLDREKTAILLSNARFPRYPNLQVCIQVNLDEEANKAGVPYNQVLDFAKFIDKLPNLTLRGLMTIPKLRTDLETQFLSLHRMAKLLDNLNEERVHNLDTLSMGMSDDAEAAIRAGSTLLRLGRAIFGARENK